MEHFNPLLQNYSSSKKFFTIGEIMLRLTPPNYEKIRMTNNFEASYGGSEANIALALANLGVDSTFFSVVPNNSLGKSAVRMLRSNEPGMCDDLGAACALGDCDGLAAARGQQMCLTSPRQEGGQPAADAVTPQVPAKADDTTARP